MIRKKIGVLLPFKDHFTNSGAGSASIWIKDFNKNSSYKNDILVCGNTDSLKDIIDKKRYKNLNFKTLSFRSKNLSYVNEFIKLYNKYKFKLIEIHNRPSYLRYLIDKKIDSKFVLIFHNNPLALGGSKSILERNYLIKNCEKLVFVSNWVKEKFLEGLDKQDHSKCIVIYPSIDKINKLPKKKKIISFVGKLNRSKGFHLFGSVVVKILNKYKNWKAVVIGDEPREKYNFKHKNLKYKGWISHKKTLQIYNETSISIAPSFWDEPFGRTSMEAGSRGCATIISKKGGLIETNPAAIYLDNLTSIKLFSIIEDLIKNKNKLKKIQKKSYQNTNHILSENTKLIDNYRDEVFNIKLFSVANKNKFKIIHISNFGNRLFNRLYFISIAKKLSNGFIRNGHDVVNLSDRDTIKFNRYISAKSGIDYLNTMLFETVKNYSPDLLVLGHSDNLSLETLEKIKKFKKNIKIAQWFEDNLHSSGPDPILNQKRLLKYSPFVDNNFITTDPKVLKFAKNKGNFHYLPIPVDKNIEKLDIYKNKNSIYDLFFTMSHGVNRGVLKANKKDERYPFLEQLLKKNPNIVFDIYGYKNRQPIWSEDFYNVIDKSKMGLNLSRTNSVKYYTSNRISSLVGNGLMTFVDARTKLNDFFDDDEIIFYKNLNDLSNKLNFYKNNDVIRKKIARNGKLKYFKIFNSDIIANYMLNKIFNLKITRNFKWMK
tara:strand:- start:47913 stop:50048 length:2136 start_codon:yes stop_codon:yes gene_type:complete